MLRQCDNQTSCDIAGVPRGLFTGAPWQGRRGGLLEAIVVGLLTGSTVVAGLLLWHLLVRPEMMVSGLSDRSATDEEWFNFDPSIVRALRWVLGLVVFLLGFLTGLALTFLSGTG